MPCHWLIDCFGIHVPIYTISYRRIKAYPVTVTKPFVPHQLHCVMMSCGQDLASMEITKNIRDGG